MATLTVNPQAGGGGGNVSCDGYVGRQGVDETFSTIRTSTGNTLSTTASSSNTVFFNCSTTTNQFNFWRRGFFTFDTSALGSGATINSATLSIYGMSKADDASFAPNSNVYGFTPAAANDLSNGDYLNYQTTAFSTAISYASFSTSGYNDFALNASGIANISKTGVSAFSWLNTNYDVANSAPTWSSNNGAAFAIFWADNGSNEPKIVIDYTPAVNTGAGFFLM